MVNEHGSRYRHSYAYRKKRSSSPVLAFGEVLCQNKSRTLLSKTVPHEVIAFIGVNKILIARPAEDGAEEEENIGDEYERHAAIEAMLFGQQVSAETTIPMIGLL
ncbi:hypothetical protein BDW72DRAFT_13286 [Aspergillus terricola var. indicus]